MKIICDNCGAKYSIADEKVKGKVFKIRCKKCQESIVVRGDTQEQPEPAEQPENPPASEGGDVETRVFDYSGYKGNDPVWYVAVDGGEQQGPYTTEQMKEYLQAGNIMLESYIWREGLEDWKTVSDVPEIADTQGGGGAAVAAVAPEASEASEAPEASEGGLFDSAPAAAEPSGGGLFDSAPAAAEPSGGLFDAAPAAAQPSEGGLFAAEKDQASPGDVFSSAPDTSTGGLFSADQNAAAATKEGGGLFDGPDASGTGGDLFAASDAGDGGGIFASTEAQSNSPRVSTADAMTGQRNENSVLFSLSNLQALASDTTEDSSPSSIPPSAGAGMSMSMPAGGSEASGLIDIRAMASSLADEAEKADDVDEMLSLGGGGFASTLGAPVLTAVKPSGMSMGMKVGIGAGVVAVLIGLVIAFVMFAQKDKDTAAQDEKIKLLMQQIQAMQSKGASAEEILKAKAELEKTKDEKNAIQSGDVVAMKDPKSSSSEKESAKSSKSSSKSSSKRKSSSSSSSSKKSTKSSLLEDDKSAASAPAPAPKRKAKTNALDSLLGGGGSSAPKKKKAATTKLTRPQVIAGMNAVRGSVNRCGAGKSGTFKIRAKIGENGRVAKTQAVGDFAGTPAGTCAANAVKRARFPQSSAPTNVTYPFKI